MLRRLCLLLALLPLPIAAAAQPISARVVEEAAEAIDAATLFISRDGLHYARIRRTPFQLVPIVDGRPQPPADWVANNLIQWSDDGRHFFYITRGRDGRAAVVYDGVVSPILDRIDDWRFTPDGHWMIAGRQGSARAGQGAITVIWADGRQIALLAEARLGDLAGESQAIVEIDRASQRVHLNGAAQAPYQTIGAVCLSRDGRRLAYQAQSARGWHIVADGMEGAPCDTVSVPAFTGDAQLLTYAAARAGRMLLVTADAVTELGPAGQPETLYPSPDGRRSFVAIRRGAACDLYVDGRPVGEAAATGEVTFSPDGRRLAYVAVDAGNRSRIVVDGVAGDAGGHIYDLRFSPDGRRWAATQSRGRQDAILLDGQILGTYDSVVPMTLAFSPDGRHLAAIVRDAGRDRLLIDGRLLGDFDAMASGRPLAIDATNTLHGFAVRGRQVLQITVALDSLP
jgi:dipeptidyl aminopeptidase/acylaminoacyl peptidase